MPRTVTIYFTDGPPEQYANAPDDITPQQVVQRASADFPGRSIREIDGGRGPAEDTRPEAGFWNSLIDSATILAHTKEAAIYAADPTNAEKRKAFLKSLESEYKTSEFTKINSLKDLGQDIDAFKEALGGSIGQWIAPAAVATGAGLVGTATTGPVGGATSAIAAGRLTRVAQYEIQALQRQAEEQEKAIKEGRRPEELALGKSLAASTGEAALDEVTMGVYGKVFRNFPVLRNLLKPESEVAEKTAKELVEAAEKGKITYRGNVATAIVKGAAVEAPTEAVQQLLERWQAGLPLTDDEAVNEYAQAAVGAALLALPFGSYEGHLRTKEQRAQAEQYRAVTDIAANRLNELDGKEKLNPTETAEADFIRGNLDNPYQLAKKYGPEKTDLTKETEEEKKQEVTAPPEIKTAEDLLNAPPRVMAENAPEEVRNEPKNFADADILNEINKTEDLRSQIADILFDNKQLEEQARKANVSVDDLVNNLRNTFDELTTRLDVFHNEYIQRKQLQSIPGQKAAPPPPEPVTPVSPVQQGVAPQGPMAMTNIGITTGELASANVSPELVKALNIQVEPETTTAEVPSGAEQLTPTAAETVGTEPTGRGAEVPPSERVATRPDIAETEPAGVEPAARVAPDVDVGEAAGEPALTPAEEAEPQQGELDLTARPQPGTFDPLDYARRSAQEAINNADAFPSLTDSVREFGSHLERTLSNYGITDPQTVDQIRKTFNDEVARLSQEAPVTPDETVVTSDEAAPEARPDEDLQPETLEEQHHPLLPVVNNVFNTIDSLPRFNPGKVRDAIRALVGKARAKGKSISLDAYWHILGPDQREKMYGNILTLIKPFNKLVRLHATSYEGRIANLRNYINTWTKVLRENVKSTKDFFEIATESTRLQVEFNNLKFAKHPLTRRFNALPDGLKKIYWQLISYYRDKQQEYLENAKQYMTYRQYQQFMREMAEKRLRVYLPLFRQGDFWMRYLNADGDEVVSAFESPEQRDIEWKIAESEGATARQTWIDLGSAMVDPKLAGPFFSKVLQELEAKGVSESVRRGLFEMYMDGIPANSIRNQFKKRSDEKYKGAIDDVIKVFANIAPRMERNINDLIYMPQIDKAFADLKEQSDVYSKSGQADSIVIPSLMNHIEKYDMGDLRNPKSNPVANFLAGANYFKYIWGNVSTAVANLLTTPMVAYPLLVPEYGGMDKVNKAFDEANRIYFNGGWDTSGFGDLGKGFPSDWSFGANVPRRSALGRLFDAGIRYGVIRRSMGHEISQARDRTRTLSSNPYVDIGSKVSRGISWMFQNSERFSREVTLLATFKLELEKNGGNVNAAIDKALNLTESVFGASLKEMQPALFRNNIGRFISVFKNFAQTQLFLVSHLAGQAFKNESPEVRKLAAKQLLGISAMAFLFAGIHGMPFYGALTALADMLGNLWKDKDDKLTTDEFVRQATDPSMYRGVVNQLVAVDFSNRVGFNGLLFRDDERREEEIGTTLYMVEQLLGPTAGIFQDIGKGVKDWQAGNKLRAFESFTPASIRNPLRAFRFASEGVVTRKGDSIYDKDRLTTYQLAMQTLGFTPTAVAERYESANALYLRIKNANERRQALLNNLYAARKNGSNEMINKATDDIYKFNGTDFIIRTGKGITGNDVLEGMKRLNEESKWTIYGVKAGKKAYRAMREEYKKREDR